MWNVTFWFWLLWDLCFERKQNTAQNTDTNGLGRWRGARKSTFRLANVSIKF